MAFSGSGSIPPDFGGHSFCSQEPCYTTRACKVVFLFLSFLSFLGMLESVCSIFFKMLSLLQPKGANSEMCPGKPCLWQTELYLVDVPPHGARGPIYLIVFMILHERRLCVRVWCYYFTKNGRAQIISEPFKGVSVQMDSPGKCWRGLGD